MEQERVEQSTANRDKYNSLFRRLYRNMSVPERVAFVLEHSEGIELRSQTQVAWECWSELWEQHYRRPYYGTTNPANNSVIAKDKKNLKDKIRAAGFAEVIDRMKHCHKVCDTIFPCVISGKWQRPILLNDFVNNHFFNQWIPLSPKAEARKPKTREEKLKEAEEKKRDINGPPDAEATGAA